MGLRWLLEREGETVDAGGGAEVSDVESDTHSKFIDILLVMSPRANLDCVKMMSKRWYL